MLWQAAALLAVLGLTVALAVLATPMRFTLAARTRPVATGTVTVSPFGGIGPVLTLVDSSRGRRKAPRKRAAPRARRKSGKRPNGRALGQAALRLLSDLGAVVRFERLEVSGEYGLDDPADTGQLAGWIAAAAPALAPLSALSVQLTPRFDGTVLDGRVEATASVVPLRLVPPAVRFGLSLWRARR